MSHKANNVPVNEIDVELNDNDEEIEDDDLYVGDRGK